MSVADADGIFRRSLHELGVSLPRRWMMWAAVRAAHRLRGASAGDVARFVAVAVPSVFFMVVPVTVVTVFLLLFWLVELAFWAASRVAQRTEAPPPDPQVKTA
ncbi:DUF1353 domain-containing protein [Nocardia sp. NPDC004573]